MIISVKCEMILGQFKHFRISWNTSNFVDEIDTKQVIKRNPTKNISSLETFLKTN